MKQKIPEINHLEWEAIFRDLHDTVCQELSGIGFLADSVRQNLPHAPESALQDVDKIIASTQKAIHQARNIARNLRPWPDDPGSLRTALLELAAYIESIYGVACRVAASKKAAAVDGLVATQLLLIAREAAINAAKHASARSIRICLDNNTQETILRVSDNGKGMGMAKPANRDAFGGMAIMRSRAQSIEAHLSIGPGKKGGTVVECRRRKGCGEKIAKG